MRKNLVLFLIFFSCFLFFFRKEAYARCTADVALPSYVIGDCDSLQYDCNNSTDLSQISCEGAGGCHERIHMPNIANPSSPGFEIDACYLPYSETAASTSDFQPRPCNEGTPQEGMISAVGCIPVKNVNQFVGWLFVRLFGVVGGIAFLLVIFAAIQILASSGDPKRLQAGKELLGSALTGLLFIIFSFFLLQLIGVKILQIPGFGTP